MDRVFRRHGILPNQLTAMDRLAYVGGRGMGALEYAPVSSYAPDSGTDVELVELGEQAGGRYHMHSVCGLLDADFRAPSMDYEDLIKAGQVLCASPAAGQSQFARAVFNLFALNQDDHSKNWAFLQDDDGQWRPSPFHDVTFSPSPHGEHATAFVGHGSRPPLKAVKQLARQANFRGWRQAREVIACVVDAIGERHAVASDLGIGAGTRALIGKRLSQAYRQNKGLLSA